MTATQKIDGLRGTAGNGVRQFLAALRPAERGIGSSADKPLSGRTFSLPSRGSSVASP
jgi:hypothetical protein